MLYEVITPRRSSDGRDAVDEGPKAGDDEAAGQPRVAAVGHDDIAFRGPDRPSRVRYGPLRGARTMAARRRRDDGLASHGHDQLEGRPVGAGVAEGRRSGRQRGDSLG